MADGISSLHCCGLVEMFCLIAPGILDFVSDGELWRGLYKESYRAAENPIAFFASEFQMHLRIRLDVKPRAEFALMERQTKLKL